MSKNKTKDTDYLYLTAMLRAREPKMLNMERMGRMLEAGSFDEAAKLLVDCGFEDMSGMNSVQVEQSLKKHLSSILDELSALVPDSDIVGVFRLKYDYHNAKVLLKAEGADVDGAYLLSDAGNIPAEDFAQAYHNEDFRFIPKTLGDALLEAKTVISRTENPQLADFILDKAYFSQMIAMTEELSNPFMREYVATLADSANLRAAVRTKRMGREIEFLRKALVPGGTRDEEAVAQSAMSGEGLDMVFSGTVFEAAAEKGVQAARGGSLMEFELACDNAITAFLTKAKSVSFGAPAVVAYLFAAESEITAVRMILTGKLSGVQPEKLKERLRETYA